MSPIPDGFQAMCQSLNIPLRPDKTVDPCQSLMFLGVIIDVASGQLRLLPDKL